MSVKIYTYSHYFKVIPDMQKVRELCGRFAQDLVQWNTRSFRGKMIREPYKVFAASTRNRSEFRFHITLLDDFIHHLENHGIVYGNVEKIKVEYEPTTDPNVELKIKAGWKPMEHQVPILEYLDQQKVTANNLVTLYTGGGKSYVSMQYASNIGKRVIYLLRPAFMDKWWEDVHNTLELKKGDVVTVNGSDQLKGLLGMFSEPGYQLPKIILLSNKTYQSYLKLYEEYGREILDMGYDCLPEDLYAHLGVGIRFIDEVHLDFHLNFKADMYTNIPKAVAMSASLVNQNPFLLRMYNIAYPQNDRYKSPPPKKYIEAKAVFYKLQPNRRPQTSWPGRTDYSHGAFEKWIMKDEDLFDNYLAMLDNVIKGSYIADYKPGDRLLVFCYSIDMATRMAEYLTEQYPDKTVERYVEDDEYANVMEPDIRVSTVLSAGTGIDIKKLKVAIMTTAISSEQSNIQALGRLRELKDDDRPPIFIYFNCEDVPKHMEYHLRKKELFSTRVKSLGERYYERKL